MLFIWSITHKTAPLKLREKVALNEERAATVQRQLLQLNQVRSCLVLSTCNRTEICLSVAAEHADAIGDSELDSWLIPLFPKAQDALVGARRILRADAGVLHLMRVASGMESQMLGDAQVLGQVRKAWQLSCEQAMPDDAMQAIMRQVLKAARRVRGETELGTGSVSISSVAAQRSRLIFSRPEQLLVLLLGSGKTAQLTAHYLRQQGTERFVVAARDMAKAKRTAQGLGGEALPLQRCDEVLWRADIVVGASASPTPLIGLEQMQRAQKKRGYRPQLLLDLAVPRDVAAEVAKIEEVYLVNLEDLNEAVDQNLDRRRGALPEASRILGEQMAQYRHQSGIMGAAELIRDFRDMGETDVARTTEKLHALLAGGRLTEADISSELRALSRRLMHLPTLLLREAQRHGMTDARRRWRELMEGKTESDTDEPQGEKNRG